MISDKRASRYKSGYQIDGKDTVTFNPPLEVKEWEYLMECQKIAIEEHEFIVPEEKKHGKEKTEQAEKPRSKKQD